MASTLTTATWVAQEVYFFCGPAVAQMVLQSSGAAAATQDDLWDDIVDASTGQPKAGIGRLPNFPKQHCQTCHQVALCWFSAPVALLAAINERVAGNPLTLVKATASKKAKAVGRMITSINNGVAPAFLNGGDHWRVTWGYESGASSDVFPATTLAGVSVTGFYIHDPDPELGELSLVLQPVSTFMADFSAVDCGPGVSGKHVAIVV